MSRRFRFYEKKRGDRRTMPQGFGSVGEALFFGFFLFVGAAALWAMLAQLIVPEWRANRQFVETTCTVVDKQIGESNNAELAQWRPEVTIVYAADGQDVRTTTYDITGFYTSNRAQAQALVDRFEIGRQYPCWYDPLDPGHAVLARGYSGWLYLILLVPVSFVAIATRRLLQTWRNWGTSGERRAAMTKRAAEFELFEAADRPVLPTVPSDANYTNSPGTRLAYRLPTDAAPGWTLFLVTAACLLWNGVVSIFAVMALRAHLRHEPDWPLTLFVVSLSVIGVGLIYYLYRQFRVTAGIGSTRVEISHHPLLPGNEYEIFVSQAGQLTVDSLHVFLVCEESATYRQGTDTRTDRRRVYEQSVFEQARFDILPTGPFERQAKLRIPACAMHSFKSEHNEVGWKLLVRGDVDRGRGYERAFPVIVHPCGSETRSP